MFPSFDEPAFKATFALTAIIDEEDHAISNGAVISDTPGPGAGKHTVKFETTPKMSTYLVALAVGDFECISGTADEIPVRICSTPDKKSLTGFALESTQRIVEYYNRYYSIKYPFKKLDIVAVPDFAAGAMENTGRHLLSRDAAARRARRLGRRPQGHRRGARARDRAPVVRRSRDDAVVGRHLAERGLRQLDDEQAAQGMAARLEGGARRGRRQPRRDGARRAARDAADPFQGVDAGRDQRAVRSDRLREGRRRAAHARGLGRASRISRRASTPTSRSSSTATHAPRTSGAR